MERVADSVVVDSAADSVVARVVGLAAAGWEAEGSAAARAAGVKVEDLGEVDLEGAA